ncbi:peptidase M28 [Mytilinidion resinicola]|uniref:Peptide hydrolase n=1 Tax=Mytilinidion resinicola TaxID=574789 RepID=A0A6A6Z289_9PEZI|nr:peptidase M28 [Mytilinidion resinicola]KAF2815221.1 peptidase M28 [Mytilinidion resinicola]
MPSLSSLVLLCTSALLPFTYGYSTISDNTLNSLPGPGSDFDIHTGALLSPILVPRVSGTSGSLAVLQHFVDFFHNTLPEWTLEFQNSSSTTPTSGGKKIPFVNLIATRDPPGTQPGEVGHLTLVAHYDSKYTPKDFIGATDSAAPCAMLMHVARSIDAALTKKWEAMTTDGLGELEEQKGVQILLLDGEESFLSWTDTDSLYGARALAESWEHAVNPAMSTYRTPLSSISLFLLLDLLGAARPTVPSYFKTTHWSYKYMSALEARLRALGRFKSSPNHPSKLARRAAKAKAKGDKKAIKTRKEPAFLLDFNKQDSQFSPWTGIQDDHLPFMARGVEVLHIIPSPFPTVWHEMEDDGEHLDLDTVEDWATLVTAFAAEWMELEGFFDVEKAEREAGGESEDYEKGRRRTTSKTEL